MSDAPPEAMYMEIPVGEFERLHTRIRDLVHDLDRAMVALNKHHVHGGMCEVCGGGQSGDEHTR